MKRSPFVLGATAVGVAAVLSFRTHPLSTATTTTSPTVTAPSTTAPASPAAASSSTSPSSTTTTTPTTASTASATGTAEVTRYGVVQVRVTETAGRITNVTTVQLSADDPHSQEINAEAVPQLRAEVLSTQSAQIDGVSGATFTSDGYEASLQSALDKLGFKG